MKIKCLLWTFAVTFCREESHKFKSHFHKWELLLCILVVAVYKQELRCRVYVAEHSTLQRVLPSNYPLRMCVLLHDRGKYFPRKESGAEIPQGSVCFLFKSIHLAWNSLKFLWLILNKWNNITCLSILLFLAILTTRVMDNFDRLRAPIYI